MTRQSPIRVFFGCPHCRALHSALQVRRPVLKTRRFQCVQCKRTMHRWTRDYDFASWQCHSVKNMDHAAHARRLRHRAEECRVIAEILKEQAVCSSYLKLAEAYDTLAGDEDHMGSIGAKGQRT